MNIEEILIKHFGWTEKEIEQKIKILESVHIKDEKIALSKAKFYKGEFNLRDEDFNKMLKSFPTLLGRSEDNVKNKAAFYKKEFNLSREDFNKMLKTLPTLLNLSEDSVKEKQKQIRDLGISKEVLVNYPNIIAVPANCLKIRYLILRLVVARAELLSNPSVFIVSQNKTYARLAYLSRESKGKVRLVDLMYSEKQFVKKHGVESKQLMEKYKINKEIIEEFKNIVEEEEKIDFTGEEKKFIEREYGGKE